METQEKSELKFTSTEQPDFEQRVLDGSGLTLDELHANSYYLVYVDPEGNVHALMPLMFTVAIVSDLNFCGYGDRWCYASEAEAIQAYFEWIARDCQGEPAGWVRHPKTGRRWLKAENFCEINSF